MVAEHHPLDSEYRLLDLSARVIARPFAKWSFEAFFVVTKFALEHNLRISGNRQPRVFSPQYFHWLSSQTTNPVEFRKARRNLITGCQEEQRIYTNHRHCGTWFAALKVFVAVQPPVLSRRDVTHPQVRLDGLDTIRAGIDPAGVGIPRNHGACGSDVP